MGSFSFFLTAAVAGLAVTNALKSGFTKPMVDFDPWAEMADCGMTMAGCTGELISLDTPSGNHGINGTIVVKDDCTFAVHGWQFDGLGPAVEWWASMQDADPLVFPFPGNAKKIATLTDDAGEYIVGSENGGDSEIVVRLGKTEDGMQKMLSTEFNHISVWCEEFAIDFGNAALVCH